MWTSKNRRRYDRSKLRYPSDLTDDEWKLVEHLIPPGKPGGGKRTVIMREVVNGLMYVLSTGCQWRAVPKDLPPKSTIYEYFDLWTYDGTLERIHHAGFNPLLHEARDAQASARAGPQVALRVRERARRTVQHGWVCAYGGAGGHREAKLAFKAHPHILRHVCG